MKSKLSNIKDSYKETYVERYIKGNLINNVKLVAELQLELSNELKVTSKSSHHNQLIKDLHKEFIDFATTY